VAGRIKSIEKYNDLTGNRTRDFPACSIVSQSTTLPRAPLNYDMPVIIVTIIIINVVITSDMTQ
jgi:hypothetical protein